MGLKCKPKKTFWGKARFQWCTQSWAKADLATTPKSAIFWNFAKGGPRENRPKSRPTLGAPKSPRRKSRYLLYSMGLKCNPWKTFWGKARLQRCTRSWAKADLARTPKSAIFWNFAKGGPRENRPKSRPPLGALKWPRRKWRYLLISMDLKCNPWTTFWGKVRLQRCTRSWAKADLVRTPKSAIFWNFAKGGPRENRPKSRPTLGAPKSPRRKSRYLLISMDLKCNPWRTFWGKARLQRAGGAEPKQIWQGHPNRPFSEILQRGDQEKTAQRVGRL